MGEVDDTYAVPTVAGVALLSWPSEEPLRRQLAAAHQPRLLLIEAADVSPPPAADELEDWIRVPIDSDELSIRCASLAQRARTVVAPPAARLDTDGVLHVDDRWVALPQLEANVLRLLLDHHGELVRREALTRGTWPDTRPADPRALDGVVKRLRRRTAPLGVKVHTITGHGFLVEVRADPTDGPGSAEPGPVRSE